MPKILIIASHPDDEVLGAGGLILKEVKKGSEVYCLILSDGESSKESANVDIAKRHAQAEKAGQMLGLRGLFLEHLPDNQFDSQPLLEIVKLVERYLDKIRPSIVYTHSAADLNIDHQIAFRAVLTATRPKPGCFVKELYSFEIPSSTEWAFGQSAQRFSATTYCDISDFLEKKLAILQVYQQEIPPFPHPRSLEAVRAQANLRGAQSGLMSAEAFQLIRRLS